VPVSHGVSVLYANGREHVGTTFLKTTFLVNGWAIKLKQNLSFTGVFISQVAKVTKKRRQHLEGVTSS
jgi:hypothetical protein